VTVPELPEAEHTRRILEGALVGRTIVDAAAADDPIVFDSVPADQVRDWLVGRVVRGAHRRGKYLWLELSEAPHPVVHLGMTGQIRTRGDEPLRLEASPKEVDRSWPPRFTKLALRAAEEAEPRARPAAELAFTNPRRLGRVLFRSDPPSELPIAKLGFDPLLDMPDRTAFEARIARRSRAVIKSLLLDQGFAAGVGNWIADEVLYQAAIDPRRRVGTLALDEIERLRIVIEHVVATAVQVDARKDRFPKDWLFHRRWGRSREATTEDGKPVAFVEIGGRTTAWVPAVQR